ncbi:hypothetical protein SERN_1273 [Serinibacter arcticus]|uniref:Uncharacterized protein n=1 Tax=Serinibacter arcticus TaxID=1655435 RepID=A0A4Z1E225_9MICO|nr:hypothetical protein SERN_1273 [Serinibacter arcticus]
MRPPQSAAASETQPLTAAAGPVRSDSVAGEIDDDPVAV